MKSGEEVSEIAHFVPVAVRMKLNVWVWAVHRTCGTWNMGWGQDR